MSFRKTVALVTLSAVGWIALVAYFLSIHERQMAYEDYRLYLSRYPKYANIMTLEDFRRLKHAQALPAE